MAKRVKLIEGTEVLICDVHLKELTSKGNLSPGSIASIAIARGEFCEYCDTPQATQEQDNN